MKLLVDMNLSPSWIERLARHGFEAVHWSTIGTATAPDSEILMWATEQISPTRAHGLRDDAVESDAGQQEGESAEEAREHCDEALLRHCRVDELIEGPEGERNGRLGPRECGSNMALNRRSLAGSRVDGQDYGVPQGRWRAARAART